MRRIVEGAGCHGAVWLLAVVGALGASAPAPSRISNVSILTHVDAGEDVTMGFVVGGADTSGGKPVVVRAAGPTLETMGVGGAMRDPRMEFFRAGVAAGENDDWGGDAQLVAGMARVGAFPFSRSDSADAALLAGGARGANSVRVTPARGTAGLVLAEVYDATPPEEFSATTSRLINVSVMKPIGSGVALGFVVVGTAPKTVLIRAIGPSLAAAPFGVGGTHGNPQLVLYGPGQTRLAANDDWGGSAALRDAFRRVGAFPLAAVSRDAALLTTLPPGSYSAFASGVGGASGLALLEVYEVPPATGAAPPATAFTLAALPDTQYYSAPHPAQNGQLAMFTAQTDWIQAHAVAENIAYVAHLGDISEHGDTGGSVPAATQWANAHDAMSRLERPLSIPFGLAVGNHDQSPNGDVNGTTTRYNATFGVARFTGRPYYGGHYGDNNNNHYGLFSAAGQDYLVVFVEYDAGNARPAVTTWARDLIAAHPNRKAILVTHYLANAGSHYAAFGAQGGRLVSALSARDNLFLALGGHVRGVYNFRRDPIGTYGRERLTSLVTDYQFEPRGGDGFMRLYRIDPHHGYLACRSYSPYLDAFKTDYGNEFTQSLDPRGPAEEGLVALSDDTLVVAAVLTTVNGADTPNLSTVGVSFQSAPRRPGWGEWRLLPGGAPFRQVHAVRLADDRVAVFGAGQAADGWVTWQLAPGRWGAWAPWLRIPDTPLQPNGSKALSYIKGIALRDGRLAAVAWSDGGAAHHAQQATPGGAFGPWSSLGGDFRQGDVVPLSDGRLVAVAVGHDTVVQANERALDGRWSGWSTLPGGGNLHSYVCIAARPDHSLAVFATRVDANGQSVQLSERPVGGAWTIFSEPTNRMTGLARVQAVALRDGRIALFGSEEHGVARLCVQPAPGAPFGPWQVIGSPNVFEIGSVKGVALSDDSLAAVSHGAASGEYFAYQIRPGSEWVSSPGLPPAWMR